jgi:hypothetical protein
MDQGDACIMVGEHRYHTKNSCITYSYLTGTIHIDRVFTSPNHRGKGEFSKILSQFINKFNKQNMSVCIMPDRKPNGDYDYKLQDALIKTFKNLGFVPTIIDGEFYDTDLELIRNKTK